jgi:hypothetical protein
MSGLQLLGLSCNASRTTADERSDRPSLIWGLGDRRHAWEPTDGDREERQRGSKPVLTGQSLITFEIASISSSTVKGLGKHAWKPASRIRERSTRAIIAVIATTGTLPT